MDEIHGEKAHYEAGYAEAKEKWKAHADRWRRHAWYALDEVRRLAGEARADEIMSAWDDVPPKSE